MEWTLRELAFYADGVNDFRREQYRQQIAVAHLNASLMRVPRNKKLPRLESLLPSGKPPKPETPLERRARIVSQMDAFVKGKSKPQRFVERDGRMIPK